MSEHVLTVTEMASLGGRTRARNMTPQMRKAQSRKAYLAGAVRTIARRVDELSQEQRDLLTDALLDRLGGAA